MASYKATAVMIAANTSACATISKAVRRFLSSASRHVGNGTKAENARTMVVQMAPNVRRNTVDSPMKITTA